VELEDIKKIIIELLRRADWCSIAFPEDDVTLCWKTESSGDICVGLNFHGFHEDAEIQREIEDCIVRWKKQRQGTLGE
jgi:hypothetical protein